MAVSLRGPPNLLSSSVKGDDEGPNAGWQAALPTGPLELVGPFDWLTCAPEGSDLSFELIMESNSCCYEPINKNHFYSAFFPLSWPLLTAPPSSGCALWPPPCPRIQTLRSCFQLLGDDDHASSTA